MTPARAAGARLKCRCARFRHLSPALRHQLEGRSTARQRLARPVGQFQPVRSCSYRTAPQAARTRISLEAFDRVCCESPRRSRSGGSPLRYLGTEAAFGSGYRGLAAARARDRKVFALQTLPTRDERGWAAIGSGDAASVATHRNKHRVVVNTKQNVNRLAHDSQQDRPENDQCDRAPERW